MKNDYEKFFPLPYPMREEQICAINFALEEFEKGKRFVILEMGTGTGKSASAVCLSKYMNSIDYFRGKTQDAAYKEGAWFLTTQKLLQDQYINDFGYPKDRLASIKSSSNYQCNFFKQNTCSESLQLLKEADENSPFYKCCQFGCKYRLAKRDYLSSLLSLTNFSYFLTITAANRSGEAQPSRHVVPRELLIIDEAHSIEPELSKAIEVTVNENFSLTHLKLEMPSEVVNQSFAFDWIKTKYAPKILAKATEVSNDILALSKDREETEEIKRLTTNYDRLIKHYSKIEQFISLYDKNNWVFNHIEQSGKLPQKLEFKPIDVGLYSEEYLFRYGRRVILMSATILNKEAFCESIGIDSNQTSFISIDSPFPTENRPVVYIPIGKMNKDEIFETLPKLSKTVKSIINDHKGEKGLIHSRTFQIANYLMKNIKDKRLLLHESDNREDIINEFLKSKKDLILVSPSSTEGLDLKDDLSRFQIICKIYWPYLGDELVKRRMKKYTRWYSYQAAKSIVQAVGRSIRTKEDWAVTYILDSSWEYFYHQNKDLFPEYFKKALIMP